MTNGQLLRRLFRGHVKRDDPLFRAAAETIIREERAKNHRLLADDLEMILLGRNGPEGAKRVADSQHDTPRDREREFSLLDIAEFSYDWDRIVAPPRLTAVFEQIVSEHRRRDVLAAAGLKPKQRILFYGPSGCGKTLAAQVMAAVLGYPLVTVRFDAVVSSYLGETAANLRRVFDFISRGQWVVLFDEFDAIGKDRDNPFEHGELKRVVNTLLQLMDAFHGESLLIAGTNHEHLLDEAIWRRFEAVIQFAPPTPQERVLLLRLFLRGFDASGLELEKVARRTNGATGADIEWMCVEAARRATLDNRSAILAQDIEPALKSLRQRMTVVRTVTGGAPQSDKTRSPESCDSAHDET